MCAPERLAIDCILKQRMAFRCNTGESLISVPNEIAICSHSAETTDDEDDALKELREMQMNRKAEIEGTFHLIRQASKVHEDIHLVNCPCTLYVAIHVQCIYM